MANSLTFRGTDLSTYGLSVAKRGLPVERIVEPVQIQTRSFAGDSKLPPKKISLDVSITAADITTLKTNYDAIMLALNSHEDEILILDTLPDRYWNARFQTLDGAFQNNLFSGKLDFLCSDPCAYSTTQTSIDFAITNPTTITHTPGGNAIIEPVYTLTAVGLHTAVTIKVKNNTIDEEIQWTGTLPNAKQLKIDVVEWIVYNDNIAAMTISGQFPTLAPGLLNSLIITNFTGNLNLAYRKKYV
jgi:predicted phage tail component-like protein